MKQNTDPKRNKPADEGRKNDPDLRDESAIQPGTNTISDSETDDANENLTETAKDDFRKNDDRDSRADRTFDEVDYD
jgi:hypothetical protein